MPGIDPKIRTRFSPSPTGFIHVGNLRTALFNYLFARHNNGTHILRIEDTDQNRKLEGSIEHLLKIMRQLGIDFDEGIYLNEKDEIAEKGSHGPYVQSQRLELYQKYAKQLVEQGNAYYCFCDQARLDELRKEQVALKKPTMYDRHCRYLLTEDAAAKLAEFRTAGKSPVIRQAIPEEGSTTYNDSIYGAITIEHKNLDDQVLLKSDGYPTYHLAVVVDDHTMEISHTIRGEEYLSSAPKHFLMYQAFGWEPPQFAHMPLILNPDKSKLSKRQGDVAVEDYLNKGYLPEALVNFIAFLGWNPKSEQEIFSLDELVKIFDLAHVNRAGAVFDINKLDWINGHYIRAKSNAELVDMLLLYWQQAGIEAADSPREYLEAIVGLEKDRLKKLSEIGERTAYFFRAPEYEGTLLVWKKSDAAQTKEVLQKLHNYLEPVDATEFVLPNLENQIKQFIAANNYDNGTVLWPLRVALTGLEKSPGPFEVAATLALGPGKAEILGRVQTAANKLS
jgi:glutamyl-tRNA synthetase